MVLCYGPPITLNLLQIKPVVIKYFFKAAECVFPCLLLVSMVFYITVLCLNQLWLRNWSSVRFFNGTEDSESENLGLRLGVFGALTILQGGYVDVNL